MQPNDNKTHWHHGQGHWAHIPPAQWNNWTWQYRHRITTPAQAQTHLTLTPEEHAGCQQAPTRLALAITPHYFNLIDPNDPHCPIRRQIIPRIEETHTTPDEHTDPIGEETTTPIPGLVHRYPDRVLLLLTSNCAAYCRYCTRSRLVSNAQAYNFQPQHQAALHYIRTHSQIRDVLLSGGDPLLLTEHTLDTLLTQLRAIPHIEIIRIGTRIPVFMPQRITPALCATLRKHGPIWMNIHVNHPRECTLELDHALKQLTQADVHLGNQSVLLRGVNDDLPTLRSLLHRLLMMRVRPYYLYACDKVKGTAHLRVPIEKGIELIHQLRGHTTGQAIPQYVIDAPGGGGKIPINPDYIDHWTLTGPILRNYQGKTYPYTNT
ncbi:MAG: KamA family radical SAM protein [Puniceicoccales bacterium]|jgi:lysine 2,3-aminomutase|nr:KamA family radical SAM protein [Puniceicoccales bacterium]